MNSKNILKSKTAPCKTYVVSHVGFLSHPWCLCAYYDLYGLYCLPRLIELVVSVAAIEITGYIDRERVNMYFHGISYTRSFHMGFTLAEDQKLECFCTS